MGLVAKAFQDIITFSRASSGTYVNSNGYITNSSVLNYLTYSNQPENAAWTKSNSFVQQNVFVYSQEFDNVNWGPSGVSTPTANTTIAPDGTLTADTVTATASTTQHLINQATASLTATPITISIYAKANTHNFLQIFHGALATNYANFNISTGVVGTVGAGLTSASMTSVGNGWFRCIVTLTPTAFSNARFALVTSNTAVYNESWTTTGTESIYLWGAQCVQGSVPGDYRATTSAALPVLYADYNGALRARKLCEDATAATTHRAQSNTLTFSATTYTDSVILKAGERTWAYVRLGASGANIAAYFNLTTGAVGTVVGSTVASTVSLGNGWFRCIVTGTATAVTDYGISVFASPSDGGVTYTGDGSSGIYIADAQLNDGSSALAYYDTTASAYNAPRFDYDPVTLAAKGLLIEEQRANLLVQSNDFQTSWAPTNVTRTLNATLSPDGNINGVKLAATATLGTVLLQAATVAATSATGSVYVKQGTGANTGNAFTLRNNTTSTNLVGGTINYSTGVFTYSTGSSGVVVTNAGNGWWRIALTATTGITSGDSIAFYTGWSGGVQTAGDFLYAYGAQLEAGAFATSYIPTVASQVTRAADVASVNTLSPWYNSVAGTIYAEATRINSAAPAGAAIEIGDGTSSNRYLISVGSPSPDGSYIVTTGGVTQASISVASGFPTNTIGKVAAAYAANDFQQATNATLGTADTSGTLPSVTTAFIGRNSSGTQWNGWLRRITYYPRRLTNAELQTLTTL